MPQNDTESTSAKPGIKFRLPRIGCFSLFFLFFVYVLISWGFLCCTAFPPKLECETPTEHITVYDPCNVLHKEDREALTKLASDLAETGKCDVALLFVNERDSDFQKLFNAVLYEWVRNQLAIYLYPSICLFEGTPVSLGRGTDKPFLCYGHPDFQSGNGQLTMENGQWFSFTPRECEAAKNPPQKDHLCYGVDLSGMSEEEAMTKHFDLEYVIDAYNRLNIGEAFFTKFFVKLTGQDYVQQMIMEGKSADAIAEMWQEDVKNFKVQRKPYLLYEE